MSRFKMWIKKKGFLDKNIVHKFMHEPMQILSHGPHGNWKKDNDQKVLVFKR